MEKPEQKELTGVYISTHLANFRKKTVLLTHQSYIENTYRTWLYSV